MFSFGVKTPTLAWIPVGALLLAAPFLAAEARGDHYALLVGVRQYDPNELRSLPYSEADVEDLAKVFRDSGYREANVVLMTQTLGAENTRLLPLAANIRKELKLLLANRSEDDVVVVAFAGHGVQFVGEEDSYFCPADARLADQETLVSFSAVYDELEKCPAKMKVMLVDACRNDPQSDNSRAQAVVDLQSVSRPPKREPAGGLAAFYSCSAGERAFEHADLKHGVFFHYVIQGLKGGAAGQDRSEVTLDDLQPFVKRNVSEFVRHEYGWLQRPEVVGKSRGLVPLVKWEQSPPPITGQAADAGALPLTPAPKPVSPGGGYDEGLFTAKEKKIRRVIAFRRITDNKLADEEKLEPSVVKISGNGAKIAFFAPKSGLWSVNSDGSELTLVRSELPERRGASEMWLELSPDGKVIYYQVFGSGIFRINSDGTDQRPLINRGAEYHPFRLVQSGHRIFFSRRDGIYSIDTLGNGDYRTILTPKMLEKLLDTYGLLLGAFTVNELGTRVACVVHHPKLKRAQLFAINADGTDFRHLVETDFEPAMLTMKPDGSALVFWNNRGGPAYLVDWESGEMQELSLPPWGANQSGANFLNRFSWDGHWFCFFSTGGNEISQLDGTERLQPLSTGPWRGFNDAFFNDWWAASYSSDLRKFVFISQFFRRARPKQIIVGEFNPQDTSGLPIISDVEFPARLAIHPDLPSHVGTLRFRVKEGDSKVEQAQFCLSPMSQQVSDGQNVQWSFDWGHYGLERSLIANDAGQEGDETAGDGIYTGKLIPNPYRKPELKRHLVRVVAHTENDAVVVDVDGVAIR